MTIEYQVYAFDCSILLLKVLKNVCVQNVVCDFYSFYFCNEWGNEQERTEISFGMCLTKIILSWFWSRRNGMEGKQ